jgi:hypothetical protein
MDSDGWSEVTEERLITYSQLIAFTPLLLAKSMTFAEGARVILLGSGGGKRYIFNAPAF